MARYIDANDAVKAAKYGADDWDGGFNRSRDMYIEKAINNVPTVDAVEVVRCKNCALWDDAVFCFDWQDQPLHYCHGSDKITHAEFFCANAERRTE